MSKLKKRLKNVMSVQTTSFDTSRMNRFIINEVKNIPGAKAYRDKGNIYVEKGDADIYPCVVAHTDTVHDIEKEFHVLECEGAMLAVNENFERVGVGGDDKVGVFVALEILRSLDSCKVAFFRDEEVGCLGSKEADMSFFDDVAFVLQCDRTGYEDFVNNIYYTQLFTDEFSKAVSDLLFHYGRVESDGGLTDVYQLAENGLDVCVANLSCGYYDPHSDNEFIMINEVFATLDLVRDICQTLGDRKWEMSPQDRNQYYQGGSGKYGDIYQGRRYGYRRYGGGKEELVNGYHQHLPDDWIEDKPVKTGEQGYIEKNCECQICDSSNTMHYDEYIEMYYCFGCNDYVADDDIKFNKSQEDESFLEFIESRQKAIDDGVEYDEAKEV